MTKYPPMPDTRQKPRTTELLAGAPDVLAGLLVPAGLVEGTMETVEVVRDLLPGVSAAFAVVTATPSACIRFSMNLRIHGALCRSVERSQMYQSSPSRWSY